jgi:hypothetical protein
MKPENEYKRQARCAYKWYAAGRISLNEYFRRIEKLKLKYKVANNNK